MAVKKKEDTYLNLRLLSMRNVEYSALERFTAKFQIEQDGEGSAQRGFGDIVHLTFNGPCIF